MSEFADRPTVALTLGDIAGIGPEVVVRAWADPRLHALARPFVVGDPAILRRALSFRGAGAEPIDVAVIADPAASQPTPGQIPCLEVAGVDGADLCRVTPGTVDARAGGAAAAWLIAAIELALANRVEAIVTLPLHKESLHRAGVTHPGHTEILAERCGVPDHAMMLYLPNEATGGGLGVIHATLHVALRRVFDLLTSDVIIGKIHLADQALRPLTGGRPPRVAVAGLNPHAGENGLFGREEIETIAPAVARARRSGVDVVGPIAADTLFARAISGEFDAVIAMYHDQGHVALKTIGFDRAVNVTLGLPIVRTSVAHGTAFDIAWRNQDVDAASLISAVRVAARLIAGRTQDKRSGANGVELGGQLFVDQALA